MSDNDYDLVGTLRVWAEDANQQGVERVVKGLSEAADEIERLRAELDAAKQRVAELEVARVLTLSRAFQSEEALRHDRDRDLRERLVCAALTGMLANSDFSHGPEDMGDWAARYADATLAAMRKGDSDGK